MWFFLPTLVLHFHSFKAQASSPPFHAVQRSHINITWGRAYHQLQASVSCLITCTHYTSMHTQLGKHHAGSGLLGGGGGGGGGGGAVLSHIHKAITYDPTTHEAIMLILMREAVGDSRQQEGGASPHTHYQITSHLQASGRRCHLLITAHTIQVHPHSHRVAAEQVWP